MASASHNSSFRPLAEARNDPSLRGQLLERYRHHLRLLASRGIGRRLQTKADASDLVQETFLDAHRGFAQFQGRHEQEFRRWLRTILTHRLAKLVRSYYGTERRNLRMERQLRNFGGDSSTIRDALKDPQSSPSQAGQRCEMETLLTEALQRLPDDYRKILTLRNLKGFAFEEIAAQMDRTTCSVRHLWSRALGRLRREMRASTCRSKKASPVDSATLMKNE